MMTLMIITVIYIFVPAIKRFSYENCTCIPTNTGNVANVT
jgi:hypothetical protein